MQDQLINETICTACPLLETYIISFSTANRHVIVGFSVTVLTTKNPRARCDPAVGGGQQ